MRGKLKKILHFIQSRKFALILLAMIITISIIGAIIPQKNTDPVSYKLLLLGKPKTAKILAFLAVDDIFNSWYFYVISILFFLNTLSCTYRQFKSQLKVSSKKFNFKNDYCKELINLASTGEINNCLNKIEKLFKKRKYQVEINENQGSNITSLFASKGLYGKWGIIIFHFGFLIIIGSIFFAVLTKTEGTIYIGEGQRVTEEHQSYQKIKHGLLAAENHLGFQMTLKKVSFKYDNGYPDIDNLAISFWDSTQGNYEFEGKKPTEIDYQGVRMYNDNLGYAPALVLTDGNDNIVFSTFKILDTAYHLGNRITYSEFLEVPQSDLKMELQFYPDAEVKGKTITNKSQKTNNPILHVKAWKAQNTIFDGFVKPGDRKIKLEDNLFLNFPEYRHWVSLRLVHDNSYLGVFTGFTISILGLAIYLLIIPEKFIVNFQEENNLPLLKIYGYTNKFQESFITKFNLIIEKINQEIQ